MSCYPTKPTLYEFIQNGETHSFIQGCAHCRRQHNRAHHEYDEQEHEVKESRGDAALHFATTTAQATGGRAQTTTQ